MNLFIYLCQDCGYKSLACPYYTKFLDKESISKLKKIDSSVFLAFFGSFFVFFFPFFKPLIGFCFQNVLRFTCGKFILYCDFTPTRHRELHDAGTEKNEYAGERKTLVVAVITTVMIKIIIVFILFNGVFSISGYAGCPMNAGQCSMNCK